MAKKSGVLEKMKTEEGSGQTKKEGSGLGLVCLLVLALVYAGAYGNCLDKTAKLEALNKTKGTNAWCFTKLHDFALAKDLAKDQRCGLQDGVCKRHLALSILHDAGKRECAVCEMKQKTHLMQDMDTVDRLHDEVKKKRDGIRKQAEMLQEAHRQLERELEKEVLRFKNKEEAAKLGPDPYEYPMFPFLSSILDNLDVYSIDLAKREVLEALIKDFERTLLEDARFDAELESQMKKIDKERLRLMEKESGQKARQSPVAPRS